MALKIYVHDHQWAGANIIVAESADAAARIYHGERPEHVSVTTYENRVQELAAGLEEHEIVAGLNIETLGDQ